MRWRAALRATDRLNWGIRIRWFGVVGFTGLALGAWAFGLLASVRTCLVCGALGAIVNATNQWCVNRGRYLGPVTGISLLVDQTIITFVVVETGGFESPFVMMYVVQVLTTAMLVETIAAVACVAWAILLWVGLLALQSSGVLAIAGLVERPEYSPLLYQGIWTTFLLYGLGLLTYVGGHISRRLLFSQEDLDAKNRELAEALASLRAAYDRLQRTEAQLVHAEKMRGLGQLVAGIAHELNNPISFVSANVDPLRRYVERLIAAFRDCERRLGAGSGGLAPSSVEDAIDDLPMLLDDFELGARRTKQIVDDLGVFARGGSAEPRQMCEIGRCLDAALTLLAHRLRGRIEVDRDSEPGLAVECRPGQISQLVVNLVANAVDAIGERPGRIEVRSRSIRSAGGEPAALIEVSDTGQGMSEEEQRRATEPFFTTKPVGQGTGLGLSICHGIVEGHGGEMRCRSQPGEGTTFSVILPLAVPTTPSAAGSAGHGLQ